AGRAAAGRAAAGRAVRRRPGDRTAHLPPRGGGAMTAPYWRDDHVTLYLGDCAEITEWLTADVLVTDPPYGRAWRQGRHWDPRHTDDRHGGIDGDTDTTTRDNALKLWGRRPAVVFGDLMLA